MSELKHPLMPPVFAIVMPVIHSLANLEQALTSLAELDYPRENFTVVLIDCRVVAGLALFLQRLNPCPLTIVTLTLPAIPPLAPRLSWLIEARINEARNAAVKAVKARYYIFTEDDCGFPPGWLCRYEAAVDDDTGAGGPDLLPPEIKGFPRLLDHLLNSPLGTSRLWRNHLNARQSPLTPCKENMLLPALILEKIGSFPEAKPLGGELEMVARLKAAGFQLKHLNDNPVWHRRVTTILAFFRLSSYIAKQKVVIHKEQRTLFSSLHGLLLLGCGAISGLAIAALVWPPARLLLGGACMIYGGILLSFALVALQQTRSIKLCLGLLLLNPAHHLSIAAGVIRGFFAPRSIPAPSP